MPGSVSIQLSSLSSRETSPVVQCVQGGDTELEHDTMLHVENSLARVDRSAELEVIRFAACAEAAPRQSSPRQSECSTRSKNSAALVDAFS